MENEKCGKMKSLENMECGNEDSGKSVEKKMRSINRRRPMAKLVD